MSRLASILALAFIAQITFMFQIACAAPSGAKITAPCDVKVGGVPTQVPPPTTNFSDVTDNYRGVLELSVPSVNRLLCGFVLSSEVPIRAQSSLSYYALVEIPRRAEYVVFKPEDFNKVVNAAKTRLGVP